MKFVKQNLTVLICAVVALLLVLAAFVWPVPGWLAETKDEMTQRLAVRGVVKQLTQTSLNLPGLPEKKGVPSPAFIAAKKGSIDAIDKAKKAVEKAGQEANAEGRVNAAKVPLLPIPGKGEGIAEAGYLPKLRSDPMKYKADYNSQFRLWTGWLATGEEKDSELDAATPPDSATLKSEFDEQQRSRATSTGLTGVASATADPSELNNYEKRRVMNKAAELRMYVERNAFQLRSWASTDSTPDETQIFESLVDSWFQSDVVKAIVATNQQSNPATASEHGNVARSAVKRLTRVVIGVNALHHVLSAAGGTTAMNGGQMGTPAGDPGALFLLQSNAGAGGGQPSGQILASGGGAVATTDDQLPANDTHYEVGMSGRSGGRTYDVVMMDIVVDIDPAKLNAFIDELYKRNMGYTVSSVQIHTVDPLDRVSNGYLYGEGQVVEAEILVEGLMFRSWTRPIMPDNESAMLGISPYKPAPAPGGNP